jgi:hypothetical protein
MDWYLLTAVINSMWNLLAILFLLYRFTSFFTYTYNFLFFCGRLWKGLVWTKNTISDYVQQRRGYQHIAEDDDPESQELLYDNNVTDVEPEGTFMQSFQDIFKNSTFDKSSVIELRPTPRRQMHTQNQSQLGTLVESEVSPAESQSFSYLHKKFDPRPDGSVFEYADAPGGGVTPMPTPTGRPYNAVSSSMLMNSYFINQTLDSHKRVNTDTEFQSQILTPHSHQKN